MNGDEQVVGELGVRASRRQIQELLGWAGRYPQRSWAIGSAAGLGYPFLLGWRRLRILRAAASIEELRPAVVARI